MMIRRLDDQLHLEPRLARNTVTNMSFSKYAPPPIEKFAAEKF